MDSLIFKYLILKNILNEDIAKYTFGLYLQILQFKVKVKYFKTVSYDYEVAQSNSANIKHKMRVISTSGYSGVAIGHKAIFDITIQTCHINEINDIINNSQKHHPSPSTIKCLDSTFPLYVLLNIITLDHVQLKCCIKNNNIVIKPNYIISLSQNNSLII